MLRIAPPSTNQPRLGAQFPWRPDPFAYHRRLSYRDHAEGAAFCGMDFSERLERCSNNSLGIFDLWFGPFNGAKLDSRSTTWAWSWEGASAYAALGWYGIDKELQGSSEVGFDECVGIGTDCLRAQWRLFARRMAPSRQIGIVTWQIPVAEGCYSPAQAVASGPLQAAGPPRPPKHYWAGGGRSELEFPAATPTTTRRPAPRHPGSAAAAATRPAPEPSEPP